jgi:hypothetical protein
MVLLQPLKYSKQLAVAAACLGAIVFRLPELLNPGIVNSDSAIVGLQAMHVLRGEWQWFLWGSGYQTTADSVVAAGLFALLGTTPLVLMLTALMGHLLAISFAVLTLARRLSPWVALLLVLPLVFGSAPTHTYTLHPPRQTALTLVFAAVFLLDGAASARCPHCWFTAGAALATFACFADPYALVFLPGVAVLAVFAVFDVVAPRKVQFRRLGAAFAGAVVGVIPFAIVRSLPQSTSGQLSFDASVLARNWALFKGPCLQWVLGTRVLHEPVGAADYVVWQPPLAFALVQWLGVVSLVAALVVALIAYALRVAPWELRRLGVLGIVTVFVTVAGFLLSVMPMDHYSSRYLVAIVLVTPFVFAPVAALVRPAVLVCWIAPMVASFAVCGWLGYEPCVQGVRILDTHSSETEAHLARELARRHIEYAQADYWAAYRLTFMFKEAVKVVPIHAQQDRYAPYRNGFSRAGVYAYIYDHRRSEESPNTIASRIGCEPSERFSIGDFDVYVVQRSTQSQNASPPVKASM